MIMLNYFHNKKKKNKKIKYLIRKNSVKLRKNYFLIQNKKIFKLYIAILAL